MNTAAALKPSFKIMLEPDCGILQKISPTELADELVNMARHPSSYRLPGRQARRRAICT